MAEIKQISYSNRDLLILMLKDQEIHNGNWVLNASFKFAAMNMGQNLDGTDAAPSAIATLAGFSLEKVDESLPFSVNAAEVNPA